jgi:hypothetical protein
MINEPIICMICMDEIKDQEIPNLINTQNSVFIIEDTSEVDVNKIIYSNYKYFCNCNIYLHIKCNKQWLSYKQVCPICLHPIIKIHKFHNFKSFKEIYFKNLINGCKKFVFLFFTILSFTYLIGMNLLIFLSCIYFMFRFMQSMLDVVNMLDMVIN